MAHNLTSVDWLIVALVALMATRILAAAESLFDAVIIVTVVAAIGWQVICRLYP